jgi:hypothetical protein
VTRGVGLLAGRAIRDVCFVALAITACYVSKFGTFHGIAIVCIHAMAGFRAIVISLVCCGAASAMQLPFVDLPEELVMDVNKA